MLRTFRYPGTLGISGPVGRTECFGVLKGIVIG